MHTHSFGGSIAGSEVITAKSFALDSAVRRLRAVHESGRYEDVAASINLPTDDVLVSAVEHFKKHFYTPQLRHVFLVGIGGSNLGTQAVLDALYRWQTPAVRIHMVDTVHAKRIGELTGIIAALSSIEECLLVSISKSGGTTETIANTEILAAALKEKDPEYLKRMVVITDTGSAYAKAAEEKGVAVLLMPPVVGGRYSVFSAVGMFPLALAGVDIKAMRQGAADMLRTCTNFDTTMNPAVTAAVLQHEAYEQGYTNHTFFAFADELESLGKWWRQLVGESLAKTTNTNKKRVGIIPTVSIGSTDLHSVGQLYLGGPKTTFTTFVTVEADSLVRVPKSQKRLFPDIVAMVSNVSPLRITDAIVGGTKRAYEKAGLPYLQVSFPEINAYEIGSFMQYAMCTVMYTAVLLDVNPFDQPEVELYKIETKHILESSQ